ncbi:hypothetical protein GGX14DRAFT_406583 [Mycena pura]|uniref:Uncharacterized protein n=1 Tax=Mycena pura TaxID=153505 RepID=A0AAD6UT07_9AGAR|nr:hypothetical protein GGX14DRAFT_406583 [Mycena pura]
MALSTSPRKVIPLSNRSRCESIAPGIQDLVLFLGETVASGSDTDILSATPDPGTDNSGRVSQRKRALTDSSALVLTINELGETEGTYVKRLRSLKLITRILCEISREARTPLSSKSEEKKIQKQLTS